MQKKKKNPIYVFTKTEYLITDFFCMTIIINKITVLTNTFGFYLLPLPSPAPSELHLASLCAC